jgi:hypothetical protein
MKTDIDSWREPLFDDVLRRICVRSGEYYRSEFRTPWGVKVSRNWPLFHVVSRGKCQLEVPGAGKPILLSEWDCAIVVRGNAHVIRSGPSAHAVDFFDLVKAHAHTTAEPLRLGGRGVATSMLCGGAAFETGLRNPLLSILPR